ncbi:hypothetical protein GH714_031824 [Hevea brasiliensis]|uniref:Plastocyanin-like domain-containing protein n=1 Tax=Hevea brasiliensis TaxID=3981 RepID=A0A6A6L694_HEVBR|nr:hypothetical protein GH714_031824 [Hevea brasiliensis]
MNYEKRIVNAEGSHVKRDILGSKGSSKCKILELEHLKIGGPFRIKMRQASILYFCLGLLALFSGILVKAEDAYRYYTWTITHGTISPLGVPQKGILINGQFPGPTVDCVTNDNIIVNVINKLDEPFLITWTLLSGMKLGMGLNKERLHGKMECRGPTVQFSKLQLTYKFQTKDQIGTFNYFPSIGIQRVAGGFGGFNVQSRSVIAIPYPYQLKNLPCLLVLQQELDQGFPLPLPDALLINGLSQGATFTGEKGKTYKFRVSNVGIATAINFRIQGHTMTLVEVEGAHTIQEVYDSLDVHVGQSVTVLNLTANAARPNPQGSFHYGTIQVVRTVILANTAANISGKLRYAVNSISYVDPATPLKLADWFNIPGVFTLNSIKDAPTNAPAAFGTSVIGTTLHDFVEIVFQNTETTIQSWHLDGYSFYAVG